MSKLYTAGTMKTDNLLIKNDDKQVVRITGGNSPRRKTDSRPRTLIVYGFLLPFGRYKFDNLLSSCVRLSRPSVTSQFCIETTGRIELVFRIDASSTYPTLCYKEIRVGLSPNARVLPSGTLSRTLDLGLKIFATASRSCCQQNSLTIELVDDTYTTVDESWLFRPTGPYMSVNCSLTL